jgi:hypothetical protein
MYIHRLVQLVGDFKFEKESQYVGRRLNQKKFLNWINPYSKGPRVIFFTTSIVIWWWGMGGMGGGVEGAQLIYWGGGGGGGVFTANKLIDTDILLSVHLIYKGEGANGRMRRQFQAPLI